jgi:ABC-type glycerol-3-phosphate transport system substrate-binding protein
MKKMSIFQIILLSTFGALAVAGMLVFAIATSNNAGATLGKIVIWGTLDQAAIQAVVRQASEANTSLSQVTYIQKNASTYESDLTQALASGNGPDLFFITQDNSYKNELQIFVIPYTSLAQTQFQNIFVDAASPFLAPAGVVAIPIVADPLVLYWNRDMLSSAGIAQPPQYWDEFYDMARIMSKKDDAGALTQSAVALGGYRNINHAKDILAALILQAGGTITTYDNQSELVSALAGRAGGNQQASPSAIRFYSGFADATKDYYSWSNALPLSIDAFTAGKLALYIGRASEATSLARTNPNLNIGIARLPQVRGASRTLNVATVHALAAARTSKSPSNAVATAYLLSATINSAAFSTALGIPSARLDVLSQPAQGNNDIFNKEVIASHGWVDPDPVQTNDIFRTMIDEIASGARLVGDAILRADQQIAQILGATASQPQ